VFTYTPFQAIQAGDVHTCAVSGTTTSGAVYCWGNNERGELGYTPTTVFTTPQQVITGPVSAPTRLAEFSGFAAWQPAAIDGAPAREPKSMQPVAGSSGRPPRR
jgi:hypothetical protein